MKNSKLTQALLVVVLALIIAIPVMVFTKVSATADSGSSVITSSDSDYTFFVIETTDVPLAAIPVDHSVHVGFIVTMTSISILALAYIIWCISITHNASAISMKLPIHLRGNIKYTNAFLHPVKSYCYIKDAEYSVAQKYVYYN